MTSSPTEPLTKFERWRAKRGWTYRDLEGLTGISAGMWCRVGRGKRKLAPETKVNVSRRLGVPVSELFDPEPIEVEQ